MDNLIKHWASHSRQFPSLFSVQSIGFAEEKRSWVHNTFHTLNFSFVLRGSGEYHSRGHSWTVSAPCVMMQFPGVPCRYGPDRISGSWDELFVIYSAQTYPGFKAMRLLDEERPVWPVHSAEWMENRLSKINRQLALRREYGRADWLDRALQSLLLDGLLALAPPEQTEEEKTIQKVRRWVQQHLDEQVDWEALANGQGMSLPTFRRHWNRFVDVPPGKYLGRIRIREARRLLVESHDSIHRIAASVGIQDPLYFSRLFRKETGIPPSQYRETFRLRARGGGG